MSLPLLLARSLADILHSDPIQLGFQFRDHHHRDFKWSTHDPVNVQSWALAATSAAISDVHVDAAGFATWVRPILGKKVWFIGVNYAARPNSSGWDKDAYQWHSVCIGPQDEL